MHRNKCCRIACESIGKRTAPRHTPWSAIARSSAVWAGIFALVCHEYPLVIMLQFLPNYMRDVLQFAPAKNGVVSAVPIACLFVSKTFSSSFSTWLTKHTGWTKTNICKVLLVSVEGLQQQIAVVSCQSKEERKRKSGENFFLKRELRRTTENEDIFHLLTHPLCYTIWSWGTKFHLLESKLSIENGWGHLTMKMSNLLDV